MKEKLALALILKVRIWSTFCFPTHHEEKMNMIMDSPNLARIIAMSKEIDPDQLLCDKANDDILRAIAAYEAVNK